MTAKTTRRIALIAALCAGAVLVRGWLVDARREGAPDVPALQEHAGAAPAAPHPRASSVAAAGRDPAAAPAAPALASSTPAVAPPRVRLAVQAPTDVRAGEVFQARVHLDANLAMRSLAFSIRYDESRLGLVGRSEGVFARQPGVPAELAFDEPSDGNVEVVYRARHGSTASGAGSIAVLEFEALRPGSSAIELRGVRTVDAGGAASARAATTDQRVVVH